MIQPEDIQLKELPKQVVPYVETAMAEYIGYVSSGGNQDLDAWLESKPQFRYFAALGYIRTVGASTNGTDYSKKLARYILVNVANYGTSTYVVVKEGDLPIKAWQVHMTVARSEEEAIEKFKSYYKTDGHMLAFQTTSYDDAINRFEEHNV